MFKLFKYLNWKEWLLVVITLLFLVAHAILNIYSPMLLARITHGIEQFSKQEVGSEVWNSILITGVKAIAVIIAILICTIMVNYLSSIITTNFTAKLRSVVYKKINDYSMAEINNFSVASLVTRTTNDIYQVQNVLTMILGFGLTAPITAVFAITRIVAISPTISLVNIASVLIVLALTFVIFMLVIPKFKKIQKTTDRINLLTRENLTGLRVVRAYSAEKEQEAKFEKTNKYATKLDIFVGRVFSILDPGITLIMQGTQIAVIWVASFVFAGSENIFSVVQELTQYSMSIIMGFMSISMLFMTIPRAIVSARRINEVLDTNSSIIDGTVENDNFKGRKKGSIKFENVCFKYPGADENVLENISFEVKPGQMVAFIGSTGSGKSTLINLIPRFYDATEGNIILDGVNIKDYKLSYLHNKIGYVPQRGVLFSGSVEENIKFGAQSASEEEVKKAIDVSESGFVYNLEDGLQHFISQGGKNVSGGQKQRLSIARAILKKPEIFIFDDSFSALDYKTDKSLRRKLKKYTGSATCLIVAQRIGTIMSADQIIVLDEGKIVGIGTHQELLKKCKIYKEIALSQLTEEELA